jgi:hypothetical protein
MGKVTTADVTGSMSWPQRTAYASNNARPSYGSLRGPTVDGCSDWKLSEKEVKNLLQSDQEKCALTFESFMPDGSAAARKIWFPYFKIQIQ